MKVKSESEVAQSCPTLRNSMDCSLSGSSVHGIVQARVLEWGAIAFSEDTLRGLIQLSEGSPETRLCISDWQEVLVARTLTPHVQTVA